MEGLLCLDGKANQELWHRGVHTTAGHPPLHSTRYSFLIRTSLLPDQSIHPLGSTESFFSSRNPPLSLAGQPLYGVSTVSRSGKIRQYGKNPHPPYGLKTCLFCRCHEANGLEALKVFPRGSLCALNRASSSRWRPASAQ